MDELVDTLIGNVVEGALVERIETLRSILLDIVDEAVTIVASVAVGDGVLNGAKSVRHSFDGPLLRSGLTNALSGIGEVGHGSHCSVLSKSLLIPCSTIIPRNCSTFIENLENNKNIYERCC